jgi:hypothetical protein
MSGVMDVAVHILDSPSFYALADVNEELRILEIDKDLPSTSREGLTQIGPTPTTHKRSSMGG